MADANSDRICVTKGCNRIANGFCKDCSKLLCDKHIQVHNTLFDDHQLQAADEYHNGLEKNRESCPIHNVQLSHCCEECHMLTCYQCFDEDSDTQPCTSTTGSHSMRTIKRVAETIIHHLQETLSELTAKEYKMSDDLKQYLNKYEETQNSHRDVLDQIQIQFEEMGLEEVDANTQRGKVINHMKSLEERVNEIQAELDAHSKSLVAARESVNEYLENQQLIKMIRERTDMENMAENLRRFNIRLQDISQIKIEAESTYVEYMVVYHEDSPKIEGSIHQVTVSPSCGVPMGAGLPTQLISTRLASRYEVWSCIQLKNGEIVFGTKGGGLRGIRFDEQLHMGRIISLCQQNNELYILQMNRNKKKLSIHMLDLLDYTMHKDRVTEEVSGKFYQLNYQIAVNQYHILATFARAVDLIGKNGNFIRTIRHKSFKSYPNGLDFLPNGTFVVSDTNLNRVSNLRIRGTKLCWKTDIPKPTGITVDKDEGLILVGSEGNLLYLLSYEGEILRVLPAAFGGLNHIKLGKIDDDKYLLACDGSKQVILYKFVTDEPEKLKPAHQQLKNMLLED